MAIDNKRRSTLKAMAAATGAITVPGFAAAACQHGISKDSLASSPIRGTGLVISFSEKPGVNGARQVIVTNTSDQPVTLSQVHPGIVSTPDGQYDLNSLLMNGSREFAPKQATTLTIKVAQTNPLNQLSPPMRSADAMVSVRTRNPRVNGGEPVTTLRNVFS